MKNEGIGYSLIDFAIQFMMGSMAIGIITFTICVIGIISFPFIASVIGIWIGWNMISPIFGERKEKAFNIRDY